MIIDNQIDSKIEIDQQKNNNSKWGILASKNINLLVGIHEDHYPDENLLKSQNQVITQKQTNMIKPNSPGNLF